LVSLGEHRISTGASMKSFCATTDIVSSVQRWPDWLTLAWYDFILPHRRAVVGPLWEMLTVVAWVLGLSIVFLPSEHSEGVSYIAYVACGVTAFGFISNVITSSPGLLRQRASLLLNVPVPMGFFAFRLVAMSAIRLMFQMVVVLATVLLFSGGFTREVIWAVPALIAYFATAAWVALLLAIVGARFADVQFAASATMRFLFFLSPVFWHPVGSSMRTTLATYNPLTYFLDILRMPLLGEAPTLTAWAVVVTLSAAGALVTWITFFRTRARLPFWL
jgi:homopolymeric O-antigen transport system permease protein